MTKRRMMLFLVLLTALVAGVCASASAVSEPITATMELTPAYLTGPGKVNVSITIANVTDADLKDPVILYDPAAQAIADFGTDGQAMLKAGESLTWTGIYDVNQRTLENGSVVYFAKYTNYLESGEAIEQSLPIRAKITQQAESALIEVKRTISPSVAQEGQKVSVDYHITNAGTVSLTNIVIKENADVHKEAQKIPELKAGQTADISYPVTMKKKNLTSGATITYKSEGSDEEQTYVVEDQTIAYGNSALTAKLTSSSKGVVANSVFTLTLNLKNSGTVDFSDIRVTDPVLGEVFSNQKLEAGKSLKLEKEITLTGTQTYQFSVTATDTTGSESVTGTEAVTVTAVNPEDALNLTLVATPDKTEAYGNPATVRFSVVITNDSNVEATDVTVSHGDVALYTYVSIPAGESRTLTRDTALSTSGKFQFTASAQDPLENTMSFKSNEMQIAIYAPTPVPATATPPPNPTAEPTFNPATIIPIRDASIGALPKAVQSVLLPVLIIAGVMLAVAGVLLLIAAKRRHDQKRASEAAYDHLERAKRRDYITPAEDEEEKTESVEESGEAGAKKPGKKSPKTLTEKEQDAQMKNRRIVGDEDDDGIAEWELPHMKYAREAASTTAAEEDDRYSALGHGLYDEEMTSDLSGYDSGEAAEGADTVMDESVMYEQPYEDSFTDDNGYTEEAVGTGERGYDGVAYTDEASYVQDVNAEAGDGEAAYGDDVYTDDAANADQQGYGDAYADGMYADGGSEAGVPTHDEAYANEGQYPDDGYIGDPYVGDGAHPYDYGDSQPSTDDYTAYDGASQAADDESAYSNTDFNADLDPDFDGVGYGDAFDNQYSGSFQPFVADGDVSSRRVLPGRRRSRQDKDGK